MANSMFSSRVLTKKAGRKWVRARFRCGFTLIELLVVIAIVAILAAVLFPMLISAKAAGQKVRCSSQIKQLATSALMYADDNNSRYVPAAPDINAPGGGLKRWHGGRTNRNVPFEPKAGPMWSYLGKSGGLKECPTAPWRAKRSSDRDGFESGCGGYGYNAAYVGGTYDKNPYPLCARVASTTSEIRVPSKTVMFTDSAIPSPTVQRRDAHLIEYSFCEPPYAIVGASTWHTTSPTVHFRHNGMANVVWCDGHVTSQKMSFTTPTNAYEADNAAFEVGWFGPDDNSLFDRE
jgi:prepilin-type N-terminal cleavage/methylation domain-containing protein/prepilin-type processing-associated H-X9-DG protein